MRSTSLPLLCAALVGLAIWPVRSPAAITYTTGGAADATLGTVSAQPGATAINFDDVNLATQTTTYSFSGSGETATFTGLTAGPNGSFVTGSSSGNYSAPAGDTTQYLAVGQPTNTTVTMTLSSPIAYFGLFWSTPDNYNTITFLDAGNVTLGTFTPTVTPGFIAAGTSTPYVNFFVTSGNGIAKVQFSSTSKAFEIDNFAFAVPEPSVFALVAGGLLMGGLLLRRRVTA